MAQNSKIAWCDHTVNLWWGCSKIHTGCKNCYAEQLANRFEDNLWGENSKRRLIKSAFKDLNRYEKIGKETGIKQKVFIGSMMDIFEEAKPLIDNKGLSIVPETINASNGKIMKREWTGTNFLRYKLFTYIESGFYPNIIFLFLTKRPENINECLLPEWVENGTPDNVWIGASASDQTTMFDMVYKLAKVKTKRFLSLEPQIDKIRLDIKLYNEFCGLYIDWLDWIIQGGESGPNKRLFNIDWAYSLKKECEENNTPYFFKQIDNIKPIPEDLQIQQFPKF